MTQYNIPLRSGLEHFLSKWRLSFANCLKGSITKVLILSDMLFFSFTFWIFVRHVEEPITVFIYRYRLLPLPVGLVAQNVGKAMEQKVGKKGRPYNGES